MKDQKFLCKLTGTIVKITGEIKVPNSFGGVHIHPVVQEENTGKRFSCMRSDLEPVKS